MVGNTMSETAENNQNCLLVQGTIALITSDFYSASRLLGEATATTDDWRARYHWALALRSLGKLKASSEVLMPLLPSQNSLVNAVWGSLKHLGGELSAAIRSYLAALRADSQCMPAWYSMGVALFQQGKGEQGNIALRRALALTSPSSLMHDRIQSILDDHQPARGFCELRVCAVPVVMVLAPGVVDPWEAQTIAIDSPPTFLQSIEARNVATLEQAVWLVSQAKRVVALTGAGISLASGLETRKQMWQRYNQDDAVSVSRFCSNPEVLWKVVDDFLDGGRRRLVPNAAHQALAALPNLAGICTQNVDELHQAVQQHEVPIIELHGTLFQTRCHDCGKDQSRTAGSYLQSELPPRCVDCGGVIRPSVVLFGETVPLSKLVTSRNLVENCDLLLVIGCAMDVSPAAELPRRAAKAGATILEINPGPTRLHHGLGTTLLVGKAEEQLPLLLERAFADIVGNKIGFELAK
jgi:NAD-dependent deacetylase